MAVTIDFGAGATLGSQWDAPFLIPLKVGVGDSDGARQVRCRALAPPLEVRGNTVRELGYVVEYSHLALLCCLLLVAVGCCCCLSSFLLLFVLFFARIGYGE